jgi:uncharacterized protein YggE
MSHVLAATAFGLAVLAAGEARSQALSPAEAAAPAKTVEISADVEIAVPPDLATLELGVETRARTAAEAVALNEKRVRDVRAALRARGVANADVRASTLRIAPEYRDKALVAYDASNLVRVKVRDVDRVGDLLDGAVGAGVNRVGGIRFSASKLEPAVDAAQADAVEKLQAQAELCARQGGYHVARLVSLARVSTPTELAQLETAASPDASAAPSEMKGHMTLAGVFELER